MATTKHKAATQVTIASTSDESLLQAWVEKYWKLAALLALLVSAGLLARQMMAERSEAERAESWGRLREEVSWAGLGGQVTTPSAAVLGGLADELQGTNAGPWARLLEAGRHIEDGEYTEASNVLRALEDEYPDHHLVQTRYVFEEDGPALTLQEFLTARMGAVESWEAQNADLFQNPPPPADAPRVRLVTSRGSIELALYEAEAPRHVENFLKLCGEGYYDGTLFHRISPGFMIQGGDPNSRDGLPDTWGQGGPDYKIEPEIGDLRHFPYVLAAAKSPMDTESSGSQFYITTGAPHHLDGQHTVFGTVVSGQEVVDEISSGGIAAGTVDRPQDPVVVQRAEIL